MEIPLFPLSRLILPEGMTQIRIFEPRYVDMISNCFRQDSDFAVCLIREGDETSKAAAPHPIATRVDITDWEQDNAGLLNIIVTGRSCLRIAETRISSDQLLTGNVEPIPLECPVQLRNEFRPLADRLETMLDQLADFAMVTERRMEDSVWVSNRLIELLPMPGKDKMLLLQMQCANDRLQVLSQLGFK